MRKTICEVKYDSTGEGIDGGGRFFEKKLRKKLFVARSQ